MRDFFKSGDHDWDIHVDYHRCTKCGCIDESRTGFKQRQDVLYKDITCHRCGHEYTVTKAASKALGPLL